MHDDIFHEIQEDLRYENLIKFFQIYGKYILGAAIAIVVCVSGYSYWQHHQEQKRFAESEAYSQALLTAMQADPTEGMKRLKAMSQESGHYVGLAELRRAAFLMEAKAGIEPSAEHKAEAIKIYQNLSHNLKVDMKLRNLATLLLVFSTLDQEDPQKLIILLGTVSVGSNPWTPLASELTALLHFKMGHFKQAADLYKNLAQASHTPESIRMRAKVMLEQMKVVI